MNGIERTIYNGNKTKETYQENEDKQYSYFCRFTHN